MSSCVKTESEYVLNLSVIPLIAIINVPIFDCKEFTFVFTQLILYFKFVSQYPFLLSLNQYPIQIPGSQLFLLSICLSFLTIDTLGLNKWRNSCNCYPGNVKELAQVWIPLDIFRQISYLISHFWHKLQIDEYHHYIFFMYFIPCKE